MDSREQRIVKPLCIGCREVVDELVGETGLCGECNLAALVREAQKYPPPTMTSPLGMGRDVGYQGRPRDLQRQTHFTLTPHEACPANGMLENVREPEAGGGCVGVRCRGCGTWTLKTKVEV